MYIEWSATYMQQVGVHLHVHRVVSYLQVVGWWSSSCTQSGQLLTCSRSVVFFMYIEWSATDMQQVGGHLHVHRVVSYLQVVGRWTSSCIQSGQPLTCSRSVIFCMYLEWSATYMQQVGGHLHVHRVVSYLHVVGRWSSSCIQSGQLLTCAQSGQLLTCSRSVVFSVYLEWSATYMQQVGGHLHVFRVVSYLHVVGRWTSACIQSGQLLTCNRQVDICMYLEWSATYMQQVGGLQRVFRVVSYLHVVGRWTSACIQSGQLLTCSRSVDICMYLEWSATYMQQVGGHLHVFRVVSYLHVVGRWTSACIQSGQLLIFSRQVDICMYLEWSATYMQQVGGLQHVPRLVSYLHVVGRQTSSCIQSGQLLTCSRSVDFLMYIEWSATDMQQVGGHLHVHRVVSYLQVVGRWTFSCIQSGQLLTCSRSVIFCMYLECSATYMQQVGGHLHVHRVVSYLPVVGRWSSSCIQSGQLLTCSRQVDICMYIEWSATYMQQVGGLQHVFRVVSYLHVVGRWTSACIQSGQLLTCSRSVDICMYLEWSATYMQQVGGHLHVYRVVSYLHLVGRWTSACIQSGQLLTCSRSVVFSMYQDWSATYMQQVGRLLHVYRVVSYLLVVGRWTSSCIQSGQLLTCCMSVVFCMYLEWSATYRQQIGGPLRILLDWLLLIWAYID